MKNLTILAAAMVFGSAVAAFAADEIQRVTCADFAGMNAASKLKASGEMLKWIGASENAMMEPDLVAKYATPTGDDKWTPEKLVVEIEGHCANGEPKIPVMERLEEHS